MASCAGPTDYLVTISTPYGDMKAILYEETPKHKANFVKLVEDGFYDSLLFHRVIPGFMIQGGDPYSKDAPQGIGLGMGGPGYTVDAEFDPKLFHQKGAIAAARLSDDQNPTKASSGSQFYIVQGTILGEMNLLVDQEKLNAALNDFMMDPVNTQHRDTLSALYRSDNMPEYQQRLLELVPEIETYVGHSLRKDSYPAERLEKYTTVGGSPHLDDQYTVFGQVVDGLEVIDRIASQSIGFQDRPQENIIMFLSVEEVPVEEITDRYGVTYPEKK